MKERGTPEGAHPAAPPDVGRWNRLTNLALFITAFGGLGLALLLAFTRPAGERLQGPLGLLLIVLAATSGTLGLVTTLGHQRR